MNQATTTERPGAVTMRFCCRKCFGVLFVGAIVRGKLYCGRCSIWTTVDVRE